MTDLSNGPETTPAEAEYLFAGNPWKVAEFASLANTVGMQAGQLPQFHDLFSQRTDLKIPWAVLRMLFNICPVIPSADSDPEFYNRLWSAGEIADQLKIKPSDIQEALAYAKLVWSKQRAPKPAAKKTRKAQIEAAKEECKPKSTPETLPAAPDNPSITSVDLIRRRGFSMGIFDIQDTKRDAYERAAEVEWFAERLNELKAVFDEPMSKAIGRQAMINELHLRRADDAMVRLTFGSDQYQDLLKAKQSIEKIYGVQWQQIEALCPQVRENARNAVDRKTIFDLIDRGDVFDGKPENEVVSGGLTAMELQTEMRESEQTPIRLRLALLVAFNECMSEEALLNPRFRRTITDRQNRILDAALATAASALNEREGVKLINLLDEGNKGEYSPLVLPLEELDESAEGSNPTEEPIAVPEVSVAMEGEINEPELPVV